MVEITGLGWPLLIAIGALLFGAGVFIGQMLMVGLVAKYREMFEREFAARRDRSSDIARPQPQPR